MADDLTKISGIGPATAEKLKSRGIESFDTIANLTDDQILQLNEELELRDSIVNADWRAQAKGLVDGGDEGKDAGPAAEPKSQPKAQTIPVQIKRDIWDENGQRHRKGTVVEMSVEAALDGVESGAVTRVK
ncbi:hypothetical protein GCM10007989_07420 [Devosia pacifica]|uniref:DUF4332 domain-containing protein n=1 Tax=Devosia pacifica TaxID=1335967 RepID=A0A918VQL2_9HYPH|nr:helix-hairpin-helix domain-containing protein [Devosia pacifica]GHA15179.1 hypothetical protein GCM10007989_07420 [Devosia pacifica]